MTKQIVFASSKEKKVQFLNLLFSCLFKEINVVKEIAKKFVGMEEFIQILENPALRQNLEKAMFELAIKYGSLDKHASQRYLANNLENIAFTTAMDYTENDQLEVRDFITTIIYTLHYYDYPYGLSYINLNDFNHDI